MSFSAEHEPEGDREALVQLLDLSASARALIAEGMNTFGYERFTSFLGLEDIEPESRVLLAEFLARHVDSYRTREAMHFDLLDTIGFVRAAPSFLEADPDNPGDLRWDHAAIDEYMTSTYDVIQGKEEVHVFRRRKQRD